MIRRLIIIAGSLLIIGVILASAFVSIRSFINPYPIGKAAIDPAWAVFFAAGLALTAILLIPGLGTKLIRLPLLCLGGVFLVLLVISPARIALIGAIFFMIFFTSIGTPVVQSILPASKASLAFDTLIFAWGIGFGITGFLVFILGIVGILMPWVLWGMVILLSILTMPRFFRRLWVQLSEKQFFKPENWFRVRNAVLAGLALVLGIGSLMWALTPSIRYDALVYHLAAPEAYLQYGKIIPQPMNFQTYQAHTSQMVNTLAMGLFGQPLPSLLHLTAGLFTILMTYLLARKLGGPRLGLLAGFLLGSLPFIGFEAGTAYNDLYVTLFGVCCLYALLEWNETHSSRWLLMAGLMAGLALGVKFSFITLLLPLSLVLAVRLFQRHMLSRQWVLGAAIFGLPVILLYAPWGIRDYLWTGNPFFPLIEKIFPSPVSPVWSMVKDASPFPINNLAERILRLPWDLDFHTSWFDYEGLNGGLGAVPLLTLPWLYLSGASVTREERRRNWFILLFTGFTVILSFITSTRLRTMMHLLPLMSLLAALNIETLWRSLDHNHYARGIYWGAGALVFIYLFSTRLNLIVRGWEIPERFPYRAALGLQTPQDFLAQNLRVYNAFQALDHLPGNHKVLAMGTKFNLYTRSEIWGDPISGGDVLPGYQPNAPIDELAKTLAGHSFDYLLVDWEAAKADELEDLPVVSAPFLAKYTHMVYSWNNVAVYALSREPVERGVSGPNNLLQDASFETLPAPGKPFAWAITAEQAGKIFTEAEAHSGVYSAVPDPTVAMFQEVPVTSGQLYTLSHWTRAVNSHHSARLQINWENKAHAFISASIQVVEVTNDWAQNQLSITTPPQAAYAQIFVGTQDNSPVYFDDFCFGMGDYCKP